jgi:sporulation protein YlmC with PRC-barrel domain
MIALAAALSAPVIIEAQTSLSRPVTPSAAALFSSSLRANGMPISPGAPVYNAQNERIGSIADVVTDHRDDISGLVLSLGGFRGITGKLVEVPANLVQAADDKLVIGGATKDQLMRLPEYQYGFHSP